MIAAPLVRIGTALTLLALAAAAQSAVRIRGAGRNRPALGGARCIIRVALAVSHQQILVDNPARLYRF